MLVCFAVRQSGVIVVGSVTGEKENKQGGKPGERVAEVLANNYEVFSHLVSVGDILAGCHRFRHRLEVSPAATGDVKEQKFFAVLKH